MLGGLTLRELLWRTWEKMSEHELMTRAAAAAYYALTALVPFLAVLVTLAAQLAPSITGPSGARAAIGTMTVDEFRETLSSVLPDEAYEVVAGEIARIQKQPLGLLSLGLVVSLWLASGLFGTIIDALNRIHGVEETRPYWILVLTAIGLTVLQAVIMVGTLVTLVAWPLVAGRLGLGAGRGVVGILLEWLGVSLAILFSFAMTLYIGPNVPRRWRWITPGSVFGTMVLLGASLLLRVYVHDFANYGKTYGSLSGVMLLLFWFWIAALILLVVVQMNKIIDEERARSLGTFAR